MTEDDVLFGYRLRLSTLAEELGNVSAACRAMGVQRSTYYRWKAKVDRWGLEALRVRERRRPRMPNQIGPHLEQRILAFALGPPGLRAAADLGRARRAKWGGLRVSEHGVWRVLRRHNLNTRSKRLALVARHADPYERRPGSRRPSATSRPKSRERRCGWTAFTSAGSSGSKGTVWQYTAADVASGFIWAELHSSERNPGRAGRPSSSTGSPPSFGAAGWKLKRSHDRQRFGVRLEAVRRRGRGGRRSPVADQGRAPELKRLRRARPADDPRGMLAPRLRPLAWRRRSPPFAGTSTNTWRSSTSTAPTTGA